MLLTRTLCLCQLMHAPVDYRSFIMMSHKNKRTLESLQLSDRKVTRLEKQDKGSFHIYCDLDGVLVDFEGGVQKLFNGKGTHDVPKNTMWAAITKTHGFYKDLAWTKDGKQLWEAIQHLSPDILTGVASFNQCRQDKYDWCKRELKIENMGHLDMAGPKQTWQCMKGSRLEKSPTLRTVNVITCWSKLKYMESGPGAVLIDDRKDLGETWEKHGGIFIHHTSTADTLALLRERHIID